MRAAPRCSPIAAVALPTASFSDARDGGTPFGEPTVARQPWDTNDSSAEDPAADQFDWQKQWYPVAIEGNLGRAPTAVTLLGTPLVLWRDGEGQIRCFEDRCPHRHASHTVLRSSRYFHVAVRLRACGFMLKASKHACGEVVRYGHRCHVEDSTSDHHLCGCQSWVSGANRML